MPYIGRAIVTAKREFARNMVSITIQCPAVAQESLPGQFVQVRAWPGAAEAADPLLDRPLSVAGVDAGKGTFELLVRVVGRGTRLLASAEVGQAIRVTGPLGRGFPAGHARAAVETGATGGAADKAILVGGGVGLAPLKFLAQSLTTGGREVLLLVGARTAAELPPPGELAGEVKLATDDGSAGYHGTAVALLEKMLGTPYSQAAGSPADSPAGGPVGSPTGGPVAAAAIYACGPTPMLRTLKNAAARLGVPAFLSLEERMACGIGACRGCAVRYVGPGTAPGEVKMVRVCHEGPVFAAGEVDLDA